MSVTPLLNGASSSCVEVADRGFQYGDGVFTTIAVRRGVPLFLAAHLARLDRDCRRLLIAPPESGLLAAEAYRLSEARSEGVLKIQITRGIGGRGYCPPEPAVPTRVLHMHPPPEYPRELASEGVEVRFCQTRLGINSRLAGVKHMNRLEQILARAEWSGADIREGVMLDSSGHVTEGTMTNLFLVRDGVLATPKLDRCGVAGVMRALLMDGAAEAGRPVREERILPEDLLRADEVFLTNCVVGIWPVRRLATRTYRVGVVTRELGEWLTARIRKESLGACPA